MSETLQTPATPQDRANPLLRPWQTPFETPPFAEIAPEHFLPAFEQAFADHAAEFWLAAGGDPDKALRLAKMNAEVRNTPHARSLLARAVAAKA